MHQHAEHVVSRVICTSQTITMAVPRAYQVIYFIKKCLDSPFVDYIFHFLRWMLLNWILNAFSSSKVNIARLLRIFRYTGIGDFVEDKTFFYSSCFFLGWLSGKDRARNFCTLRCSCLCGMTHLPDCHN